MSQSYRIQLKTSVSTVVRQGDQRRYPISLTPILPEEEMRRHLREALLRAGYEQTGENVLEGKGPAGETIRVNLEKMEVEASMEAERELTGEASARATGEREQAVKRAAEARLQEASAAMERELQQQGAKVLREQLLKQLEDSEQARQEHLHAILRDSYAQALKEKAQSMGRVVEVRESGSSEGGPYELTIRIET